MRRKEIIGRAAVKYNHRISYNVKIALRKLSIFDDEMITLALAISGNPQIFLAVHKVVLEGPENKGRAPNAAGAGANREAKKGNAENARAGREA